ncbi:MAG: SRPBCC family protein [Actinomycetota bacterium]|nr:SRPBCC family protein [Actinomycetota bacterium]MDA3018774.1 SRPBCC family protein [Actinomycetota bacterium]
MDLNHTFTVNQPIAETWVVLTDLERIAPCLAGAELQEVHGDVFKGGVKIKVGPIVAQFKGEAQFVELDAVSFRAHLKASGRDIGGKGNASATITAQLTSITPTSTSVNVVTDLAITGKVAQFGRGALADISEKLIAQFADNLNALIDREGGAPAPSASAPVAATSATETPSTGKVTDASAEEPKIRKIEGPAAEPLNLQSVAGGAMMKRLLPIAGAILGVLLFIVRPLRRRRNRES